MSTTETDFSSIVFFRRLSAKATGRFDLNGAAGVRRQDFVPHAQNDVDGLSIVRADRRSRELSAFMERRPDTENYLAVFTGRDLLDLGLSALPDPDRLDKHFGGEPAHYLIPELNAARCRSDEVLSWTHQLCQRCTLEGPVPLPPNVEEIVAILSANT